MKSNLKYSIKSLVSLVLITILITSNSLVYATQNKEELKDKISEIEEQIKKTESNISNVKTQKSSALKEIQALEKTMTTIDADLSIVSKELDEVIKKVNDLTLELEALELKKAEHYTLLKVRMRDMYENSTVSYLDMFLQADSFIDLIDRMYNVKLIMDKDNEVLAELNKVEEELNAKKVEIEENKIKVEEKKAIQESKKNQMEKAIAKQQSYISQLSTSEKSYMNDLTALEAEAKAIEDLINGKTKGDTTVYTGGKFTWPVPGYTRVSSGYGNRGGFYLQDGSYSKPQFHTGIDIPGAYGTRILAAAAGTVITAGWVNGYGYTVLINHGSGLVTLYGHNSSLVVKVGDRVYQGQQIAKCGSTGYSTGNHCHFEVRLNGKHTNPYNYLNK